MTSPKQIASDGRQIQSSIAMYVAIISWAMLFATLFLMYAIFRFTATSWPPAGISVPLTIPSITLFLIAVSSFFYYLFEKAAYSNKKSVFYHLLLTMFFGALFIWGQFQLWKQLKEMGIYASSGIFPSLIYTFTWIHTAHMALGMLGLLWLVPLALKMRKVSNTDQAAIKISSIGKFWHFLGIVWLIIYLGVFIL